MAHQVKIFDANGNLKQVISPEMLSKIAEKRFKREFDGLRVTRNGKRIVNPLKGYSYKIDADMI